MSKIPLVEAYRPTNFEDIVLDPYNKQILKNIIETSYFPNLLFYGPPGTGKTTTIINLINAYQKKLGIKNKDLIIHLNASDERGIDIIRNQISFFVNSKPLFHTGMKFIILDEVDYMTKNAQQALRYLLQNYNENVRFCLICNYISKIEEGLQNEFLRLRFNQLPTNDIIRFLRHISDSEKLYLSDDILTLIQQLYKSDVRSMINYIQSNQDIIQTINTNNNSNIKNPIQFNIIDKTIWENILSLIQKDEKMEKINLYIYDISIKYNVDKKNIIKDFLNYIIRKHSTSITSNFLNYIENIMHFPDCKNTYFVYYSLVNIKLFLTNNVSS
jgi:DNA polymerase III delta prime subunit